MKKAMPGKRLALLLIALYTCASCSSTPTEPLAPPATLPGATVVPAATAVDTAVAFTPTAAPRPIRVIKTAPVANVVSNEEYPFSNCGGTVSLLQPFSDAAQVSAEVEISETATRSDGTTIVIDEPKRAELAQEVELAYEPELAAARAVVQQTQLVAAPFTRWNVLIVWEDRVFAAAVSYPSDGLSTTTAYTYTQHVPSIGYYLTMPCTA